MESDDPIQTPTTVGTRVPVETGSAPAVDDAVPTKPARSSRLHFFLFGATLVTTTMAGAFQAGVDPLGSTWNFLAGLPFSLTLMAILLCHEFGHYEFARRHGVPASLPYFIPGPPFMVGTFGAFIRMYGTPRDRRALFDVGAAGPWAGVLVAIPAVAVGLALSEVAPLSAATGMGITLGNSLLFDFLTRLVLGVNPDEVTVILHPVALAGWFGLFVTFLNLLPVGQLDGGHVVYALFGKRHRGISRVFLLVVLAMGFYGWDGWFVWALLLAFVLRVDHPETEDPETPLDRRRRTAAWLTMGLFVVTFMPVPISVHLPDEIPMRHPPVRERHRRVPPPAPPSDLQAVKLPMPPTAVVPRLDAGTTTNPARTLLTTPGAREKHLPTRSL